MGLYVMLKDHESCRVCLIASRTLDTLPMQWWDIYFCTANATCCASKSFLLQLFVLGMAFFRAECSRIVSWLRKNMFFLRVFFFGGPICYKNSKIPKISIYTYLTISMGSSTMCRFINSYKVVVGVAGFEIPELYSHCCSPSAWQHCTPMLLSQTNQKLRAPPVRISCSPH